MLGFFMSPPIQNFLGPPTAYHIYYKHLKAFLS